MAQAIAITKKKSESALKSSRTTASKFFKTHIYPSSLEMAIAALKEFMFHNEMEELPLPDNYRLMLTPEEVADLVEEESRIKMQNRAAIAEFNRGQAVRAEKRRGDDPLDLPLPGIEEEDMEVHPRDRERAASLEREARDAVREARRDAAADKDRRAANAARETGEEEGEESDPPSSEEEDGEYSGDDDEDSPPHEKKARKDRGEKKKKRKKLVILDDEEEEAYYDERENAGGGGGGAGERAKKRDEKGSAVSQGKKFQRKFR